MNACDTDMANGYTGWNTCVIVRFTRACAPAATARDGGNANRAPRAGRGGASLAAGDSDSPAVGPSTLSGTLFDTPFPFRSRAFTRASTRRTRRTAAENRSETSGAGRGRSSGAAARAS
jgi:hypothetical protein